VEYRLHFSPLPAATDDRVQRLQLKGPFLTRLGSAAIASGLLALNLGAAAPATDTFSVELLVFRYHGSVASPENWDAAMPSPAVPAATIAGNPTADAAAEADTIRPLGPGQFQLAGTETALGRNANYEPIAHFGFRIVASDRDTGIPVRIEPLVDSASGLSGSVTLERGRFLHLAVDLTYTTANPPANLLLANTPSGPVPFRIHQDRRIRPFERHYFDHPAFGIITIVTPVNNSSAAGD
jgi:Peptidoglycan-binding protein, CsiV